MNEKQFESVITNAIREGTEHALALVRGQLVDAQGAVASDAPVAQPLSDTEVRFARAQDRVPADAMVWFGFTIAKGKRGGMAWDARALVTVHAKTLEGKPVYRVWDAGELHFRKVSHSWVTNVANVTAATMTLHREGSEVVLTSPAKVEAPAPPEVKGNVTIASPHIIKADPLHVLPGTPVKYALNPSNNSRTAYVTVGKQTRFVKAADVKNDVYVGPPILESRTHMSKKMRSAVKRHMSGSCTCTKAWLCPAAQAFGKHTVTVGAHTYEPGALVLAFDPASAGESLRSRMDATAWGLS